MHAWNLQILDSSSRSSIAGNLNFPEKIMKNQIPASLLLILVLCLGLGESWVNGASLSSNFLKAKAGNYFQNPIKAVAVKKIGSTLRSSLVNKISHGNGNEMQSTTKKQKSEFDPLSSILLHGAPMTAYNKEVSWVFLLN